jgi:hypothetical protein
MQTTTQQTSSSSTPKLTEFDPTLIPFQYKVISDLEAFDYSKGVQEILLSGSVGSAKTLLMAHIAVVQCLRHKNNVGLLARRALPDLKSTLVKKVLDHIDGDLKEGVHYEFNKASNRIQFFNNSELICRSWADHAYKKFRSLEFGFAIIEEVTENGSEEFAEVYKEIFSRVGRLNHITTCFTMSATNPGSPSHFAYEYFIEKKTPNRHVYYSLTEQNPFLPRAYIENLKKTYSPQEARRMLFGEWIEIRSEFIYYSFNEKNIIHDHKITLNHSIVITWDFNIGQGKPMSSAAFQYINNKFIFFDEVVITGSNTREVCEEWIAKGLLDIPVKFIIRGDASGRAKSSKHNKTDYDIILQVFSNYRTKLGNNPIVEIDVPLSNPPVRRRHLLVNGQLENTLGDKNLLVTENCKTLIKGLRLTKLKDGGQYIEDDSESWQHITTAIGYGIVRQLDNDESLDNFSIGSIHGTKNR